MNVELPLRLLDWIKEADLDWKGLSSNPSCEAIRMLKKNPTKIKFYYLIENTNIDSIQILKENYDKVDWFWYDNYWEIYSRDTKHVLSSEEIQLLRENPLTINWRSSQFNISPDAIPLLKENQEKIFWHGLSKSQHIFTYNYEKMRENCLLFKEDLMKEPRNLRKFKSWGHDGETIEDDDEFHLS
jgi:hypothetical protein